jgi:glycosyltransferase involved in cell wall biosynthesis
MHRLAMALNRKIVIAIPCLLRGGTEMQSLLLVRALIELGYDVGVCCYFEWDELVVKEFQAAGAAVRLLGWPRSLGTVGFIKSLATIFRETLPTVVHVQYMAPGLLPIVAARLVRVPVVLATVHYPGTPHGIAAHGLLRLGARLTNRFTCVSEAAEKSWFGDSCLLDPPHPESIAGRRHLTIPNAVDIGGIDKALAARSPKVVETAARLEGKMVVGTVARLSREKGIGILLEAFAKVHKAVPHAHLLIVGDGSQLAYLQGLARHLGIGDSITWTGQLSWEEAMGCLGRMDVVVVPSRYEGFGLTAIEAMACGKPVVASRVDGLAEVIRDGVNGCLVKAEDASALAAALTILLNNDELRKIMGVAARRHVEEYYTYPRFRERCRVLYEPFLKPERPFSVDLGN